jgi:hypothetical protein
MGKDVGKVSCAMFLHVQQCDSKNLKAQVRSSLPGLSALLAPFSPADCAEPHKTRRPPITTTPAAFDKQQGLRSLLAQCGEDSDAASTVCRRIPMRHIALRLACLDRAQGSSYPRIVAWNPVSSHGASLDSS